MTTKNVKNGILLTCIMPLFTACSFFSGAGSAHSSPSATNADVAPYLKTGQMASNQAAPGQDTGSVADLRSTALNLAAQGDHQAAIPIFRHLLASSDTMQNRSALGASLVAVGQHSEAAMILRPVTEQGSGHGLAWYNLGKAWLALGRYDEALGAFSEAANRLDGDPRPRRARGVVFAALGQIKRSMNSFDMALQIAPGDRETLSNKALVEALTGQEESAIKRLEKLIKSGQAQARDRQNLALAYLMQGNRDKAQAMGRLDLDDESLADSFAFYQEITSLPVEYRMRALVTGAVDPAWSRREAGNLKLADTDMKKQAAERLIAKPAPKPAEKPQPKPEPVIPPLLEPEGWAVQIGAYRTIKNLVRGWAILKNKNKDILKGIPPRRSEKDFGPKQGKPSGFYYRLNAGPLKDFKSAKVLCQAFKERGTDCWIRPPEKAEGKLPK